MDYLQVNIGTNIKDVRNIRGLSQEKLCMQCGFSTTTLSAYENNRKKPGLDTLAKIARNLNVSIERLYYGDESRAFIDSEDNKGKKIVYALYFLWEEGIITTSKDPNLYNIIIDYNHEYKQKTLTLICKKYRSQIARLIDSLNQYRDHKDTYGDPEKYLEFLLDSVANEINSIIMNG